MDGFVVAEVSHTQKNMQTKYECLTDTTRKQQAKTLRTKKRETKHLRFTINLQRVQNSIFISFQDKCDFECVCVVFFYLKITAHTADICGSR